jgi:hypothetical protein
LGSFLALMYMCFLSAWNFMTMSYASTNCGNMCGALWILYRILSL